MSDSGIDRRSLLATGATIGAAAITGLTGGGASASRRNRFPLIRRRSPACRPSC
jgi:hypothetical protein